MDKNHHMVGTVIPRFADGRIYDCTVKSLVSVILLSITVEHDLISDIKLRVKVKCNKDL